MAFNTNKFISPLFKLFGKKLANVPPSPQNNDVIQFNSTSGEWELVSGVIGSAVQSSSNVGTGDGLALPRVLDDLPFKTLVDGVEIIITVSATELAFSIGAIAISKITGLQVALDSKVENAINIGTGAEVFKDKAGVNLRFRRLIDTLEIIIIQNVNDISFTIGEIAQSKITGLVTALASKIETITNIGGASEIAKAKVGTNVDLRTLLGNLEIIITTNVSDLAFSIGVIAQSKITGLVTALGTKIDTIVNVGTGAGLIFRDIVGTTANLKTLLAGTNITIINNADDITISASGGGSATPSIVSNVHERLGLVDGDFIAVVGSADIASVDRVDMAVPRAMTLKRLTIQIGANARTTVTNFNLTVNAITVNQTIAIPASTTGTFQDVTNTDVLANLDKIAYESIFGAGVGVIEINSSSMEIVA